MKFKENHILLPSGAEIHVSNLKTNELGITNLKAVTEMVIALVLLITQKPFRIFAIVMKLKSIIPGIITLARNVKAVIAEIKDLSADELEELSDFVRQKSEENLSIEDLKGFLGWLQKIKS